MKDKTKLEKFISFAGRGYNSLWLSIAVIVICFVLIPLFIVKLSFGVVYDENTANISNTIGGIASPLVALIAVVLTFFAFYIQFQANKTQNYNFNLQQFESSFFELLRLYKEIVEEIEINGKKGKLAFKEPNEMIRAAYGFFSHVASEAQERARAKNEDTNILCRAERDDFAFKLVYYGLSSQSFYNEFDSFRNDYLRPYDKVEAYSIYDSEWQYNSSLREYYFNEKKDKLPEVYSDGIKPILNIYFEHLYQIMSFVHTREFLGDKQKEFYFKIIVNQISPDEQVTLFYLSISSLGEKWRELIKIKEYGIIKNIPFLPDFDHKNHPSWEIWYPEIDYVNPPSYPDEPEQRFFNGYEHQFDNLDC